MIPILYEANETSFLSNGIGRLVDCLRCEVTEERNGIFEVVFDYPITGQLYDEIIEGRIIATIHDDNKDVQPFDIYGRSAPIDGIVTFYAHHISYRLQYSILQPFTATSCADALEQMARKCVTPCPFTFWTDKTTAGNIKVSAPVSVKEILGGVQGSILDVYGKGEYEWDKFTVKLHLNRGTDTGVQIRYGKNLVNLTQDVDTSGFYSAVVPYWIGGDNSALVTLPEWVVLSDAATAETVPTNAVPLDLSDQWEDAPTEADLRAKALDRVNSSEAWLPDENIKVDFVALWQTEEYANIASLERVKLCDRVSVIYPELGLVAKGVQAIKTVYDGLDERYVSMEFGKTRTSFASVVQAAAEAAILPQVPSKSFLQAKVAELSAEIAAGAGGIITDVKDANGNRTEMLILCDDGVTPSTPPEQCLHIWRINKAGIGYSDDYGRTYRLAITASGQIVADFITAGTMSANIIHGGTLALGGANNGNGVFVLLDGSGNEIGRIDNTGANIVGDIKMLYHTNTTMAPIVPIDISACLGDAFYTESVDAQAGASVFQTSKGMIVEHKKNNSITSSFSVVPLDGRVHQCVSCTSGFYQTIAFTPSLASGPQNVNLIKWSYGSEGSAVLRYINTSGDDALLLSAGASTGFTAPTVRVASGATVRLNAHTYDSVKMLIQATHDGAPYGTFDGFIKFEALNSPDGGITLREESANQSAELVITARGATINGAAVSTGSSSSRRYKHSISTDLAPELDPHRLYDLRPVQFVYNDGHPLQYADMVGKTLPGFIAEDVAEIYPAAVIHGDDGQVESWDERRIIPGLLALVQEQKKEIEKLKARVDLLEKDGDTANDHA